MEKEYRTDVDDYLLGRITKIKASSNLELETIEAHGIINEATKHAKTDAQTKIRNCDFLLEINRRQNEKVK